MNIEQKIKAVYELEQSASIAWTWDEGYTATLVNEKSESLKIETFETLADAVDWLYEESLTDGVEP